MIVCDDCGAVVTPESMQTHYDWHEAQEREAQLLADSIRKLRHDLLIACQQRHLRGIAGDHP
jgi:transcription initiation factor TFIIIB Brf1 subunit/transcription initiation factor TFIIB